MFTVTVIISLLSLSAFAGVPSITAFISNQTWSNMRVEIEKDGSWFNSKSAITLPAGTQTQLSPVYPYFKGEYFKEFLKLKVYESISYPYYIHDEIFLTAAFNEFGELTHILCTPVFQKVNCEPIFLDQNPYRSGSLRF